MEEKLEQELQAAMDEAMTPKRPIMRPVPTTQQSLTEQLETVEKIRWELRQRVVGGRLSLEDEFRKRRHEIEYAHDRAMAQAEMELIQKRDMELRKLADEIRERLKEFELLTSRLDG